MPRCELRLGGDDAELLLLREGAFALHVPAVGELTLVFVSPLLRHMVRRMGRARREVHEEWLVGHQRLLRADPADGLIGQVLRQVITLFRGLRRLDGCGAVIESGLPLVVLATDEAVERLESTAGGRPCVEWAHRRGLPHWHLMAFAELRRGIAVELQGHCQRSLRVRPQGTVARCRRRRLGDAAHSHRMVIAASEHGRARRRAQSRRVEAVVLETASSEPLRVGRCARPAEHAARHRSRCHRAARSAHSEPPPEAATARSAGRLCRDPSRRRSSAPAQGGPESAASCERDDQPSWCDSLGLGETQTPRSSGT